jgi:hypothetical protein
MKRKIREHILSIFFVILILVGVFYLINESDPEKVIDVEIIEAYAELNFLDYDNHFDKLILKDVLNLYYPNQVLKNDSIIQAIEDYRKYQITELSSQTTNGSQFNLSKFKNLLWMYFKFILVYVLVFILTYYGVQTLGLLRFVRLKQKRTSYLVQSWQYISKLSQTNNWLEKIKFSLNFIFLFFKAILKASVYFALFSPAYVIAYSFKTRFDTNSLLFMIILGVISNGLLITYAQKFYTFLITESRKGYVQTAIVKNLTNSYYKDGIPLKSIFRIKKFFPEHVFQHIFLNARFQYLGALKEQASFLITGLIIIEMALNIQNHLGYELLQNLLYKNYLIVLIIILGIFLVVKFTEIFTDAIMLQEAKKYENKN